MSLKDRRIGPVTLRPIFQERIWGAETLPAWYQQPAAGKPVGEAWLTAESCVVDAGRMEGIALADLMRMRPEVFGGTANTGFPLLIKTLFPREKLSVQVHPNDAEALSLGYPRGKTECWYVLSAEPGASVAVGFREEISLQEVREAIVDETLEKKLAYMTVKAGDMVYVDAGTVHAIGPGMVVLETQQYSDITYRLYDYGRPRELHVDAGLSVSRTTSDAGLAIPISMDGFTRLVTSNYFVVDRFTISPAGAALGEQQKMQMLFALCSGATVSDASSETLLEPWRIVVLPAEGLEYRLGGEGDVIRIRQP
jgi:mannose-6-phosphate isomerase